jgi:tetratricopeptide (TPR) repeat protein
VENLPYNPFDFANPVDELASFAGRKSEFEDVRYYLNHARHTRPIHLALTGERSAGKTSMLNMIFKQAESSGFLVVRLDLNEGDADPIQFFGRLYDSLLTSVVSDNKYGGFSGRTWKAYRSLVDANKEADNLPLNFPAHWVAAQQGTRSLSEAVLSMDLRAISVEVGRKILIVLDECDVLSQKKITLQILRNVFMNLNGYMLVIAGTPRLFPVFDDVFSPINRQFKKVLISPFEDEEDTRECISQPLKRLQLNPRRMIKNWPLVGDEIHQVTGGRPYEIQLLCHAMFRRVQDNIEPKMSLSLEVLDEVRMDLENRQGHDVERFATRYSGLTDRHLMAIGILRRVDDGNLDSAAVVHAVTPRPEHAPMTEAEFRRQIIELIDLGILEEVDSRHRLVGDQFDEVYLRYLAASRSLRISARPARPASILAMDLVTAVSPISHLSPYLWSNEPAGWFRADLETQLFPAETDNGKELSASKWSNLVIPLRKAQAAGLAHVRWATCVTKVKSIEFNSHFYIDEDVSIESFEALPSYVSFRDRVEGAGGVVDLTIDVLKIEGIAPFDELIADDEESREAIADIYSAHGYELFFEDNYSNAFAAFCDAYEFAPSAEVAVSAAFQALHLEDWNKAIEWANKADAVNNEAEAELEQVCLAAYDRSIAHLMLGEVDQCLADLDRVKHFWHEGLAEVSTYLLGPIPAEDHQWKLVRVGGPLIDVVDLLTETLRSNPR